MTSREEGLTGEVACHCKFGGPASEMLSKCIFLKIALEVSVEAEHAAGKQPYYSLKGAR